MAHIIGGIATSHIPSIGNAIAKGLFEDPYWKPFFDGFVRTRQWLAAARPDVLIVIYNDHGLNFFLDKMPTFAIGAAPEYRHADEGWDLPVTRPFTGDQRLSWHLIESLVGESFDLTTCQEMLVDHAFTVPMSLLFPGGGPWPVRTIPVAVNTVQHPLPAPMRCFRLGQAIGRAVASYPGDFARDDSRHRRAVASTRRHAGRLHKHILRPNVPQRDSARARRGSYWSHRPSYRFVSTPRSVSWAAQGAHRDNPTP
jgi:protocatechuate 4,5-dioxygenase beta chain